MFLPKFLIADNSEYPENVYILHTKEPRFILDVDSEEVAWIDPQPTSLEDTDKILGEALEFYDTELESYEDDEEED